MSYTSTTSKAICLSVEQPEHKRSGAVRTSILSILFLLFSLLLSVLTNAQDVLVGLTSNGGQEGKGTAFSIKTNGSNFSIIKGFADWGKNPVGDLLLGTDGNFYGLVYGGGTNDLGTIFKMSSSGDVTMLKHLNGLADGQNPYGELIKGPDGNFWGMTSSGGANGYGTIFKITLDGAYTVVKNFSIAADGANPRGHLVLAKDGNFYGLTYSGGANGAGTIFKFTTGGSYTVIHSLNKTTEGSNSYSSLTEGKDGNLYGITQYGGTFDLGTIFKVTTSGALTVLHHFNGSVDGGNSEGDLIEAADGNLYGMCYGGGASGGGTIFKISKSGTYTVLKSLSSTTGANPYGNLFQDTDGTFYGMTRTGGTKSGGTIFKMTTSGSVTVIHSFDNTTEGSVPNGSLIKGTDGNLYGMTSTGGPNRWGTAFKVTTAGALTVLAAFDGSSMGNVPMESLIKGKDSAYYGTTSAGGAYDYGTIFKICGGKTTVLHSFNRPTEGGVPKGSLIQATDGNFYGMTPEGGSKGWGTIFKITPAGIYSVLHVFNSPTEGSNAQGSLVQGTDGNLYGMTNAGGPNGTGTIFKITLTGTFTVLHSFVSASEGANPNGNLIQATDGNFYGMTSFNARAFKMAPDGTFTVLHTFITSEGYNPQGSFVQGKDGNFYGTTNDGGSFFGGTIFKMTSGGTVTVLKHLNKTPDGENPNGNLIQAADGNFYGMTNYGGTNNIGTIFKITPSGTYTVLRHLTMATDGGNPFGSLIIAPINNLVANPQSITTNEDTKKAITLTGSGGTLTYNIVSNPLHGTLTGTAPNVTYKPSSNYNGNDQFSFNVSVGCISSAPAIVSITVTPVADTPVLKAIGNKTIAKDSLLKFTVKATDADAGETVTYSLINAPQGATIGATTGVFKWTPTTTGNYTFKIRATDPTGLYDEEQITVTVTNSLMLTNSDEQQNVTATATIKATMYPNPVDDKFYVTFSTPAEQLTVRIIDLHGAVISNNTYSANGKNRIEVNASQLSRGIYMLQLSTGTASQTLRFIKK